MLRYLLILLSPLAASAALAQTTTTTELAQGPEEKTWSFSLSAYTYILEDDDEYVQPTLRADHDWLHLEARYNYEDQETTSIWIGYNFSFTFGEELALDVTPMLGGVLGRTEGVAPGYAVTLDWRGFELYSEAEIVIDTNDASDSFLYTWSELTYSPIEWLRAGVVVQRTKAYDADFDIQRGLMVGLTYGQLDFVLYVLNPDDDPIIVLGVSHEF